MATPVPIDPRTPLQRAKDQLTTANRELTCGHPSRARRRELADRIDRLQSTIAALAS